MVLTEAARSRRAEDDTVQAARPLPWRYLFRSSIGRKFLVAGSAAFLAIFALGHTVGNLTIFIGPGAINTYAHHLQSLPFGLIWVVRALVLSAFLVHAGFAGALNGENSKVKARGYLGERYLAATSASRGMMISGGVILLFIVFHILHLTTRSVQDFSMLQDYTLRGVTHPVMNVYAMTYIGFSNVFISLFYIAAMWLLSGHLAHGVASVFQSIGWRNAVWRARLERIASLYGWFVFIGLSSIPFAVLLDAWLGVPIFDKSSFLHHLNGA